MSIEFLAPSLEIQAEHKLNEKLSKQHPMEALLQLEEERLQNMQVLEDKQQGKHLWAQGYL